MAVGVVMSAILAHKYWSPSFSRGSISDSYMPVESSSELRIDLRTLEMRKLEALRELYKGREEERLVSEFIDRKIERARVGEERKREVMKEFMGTDESCPFSKKEVEELVELLTK